MPFIVRIAIFICAILFLGPTRAAEQSAPASEQKPDRQQMWQAARAKPQMAITTAFDAQGKLWRARVEHGQIMLSYSTDLAKSFSNEIIVNSEPETISAENENRPKIAFGKSQEVYLSWTRSLEQPFSGDVRFARSLDDGKTFSAPITVNDNHDIISHRFDAMAVDAQGRIHLAWLDKRDLVSAKSRGEDYAGSALYYAVSENRGESFSINRKLADHSCECCRVAMAIDRENVPVIFWRHVFDNNVRDHALLRLDDKPQLVRVSFDQWQVEACPHHGGTLSIDANNTYHLTWFNNGPQRHGLFYAQSKNQGKTFSTPLAVGNYDAQAAHPFVRVQNQSVYLVWKEFDGKQSLIQMMQSTNAGTTWKNVTTLASTDGASDHPLLISNGQQVFLSWNTSKQGLVFLPLHSGHTP
jgi:hypothetical protein